MRTNPADLAPKSKFAGAELSYTEFTSNVSITAVTEGAANTVVTSPSVYCDGTAIKLNFFAIFSDAPGGTALTWIFTQDGISLGFAGILFGSASQTEYSPDLKRRLVPSVGSHIFAVKGFVNTGTGTTGAGVGGVATRMPGYLQITKV